MAGDDRAGEQRLTGKEYPAKTKPPGRRTSGDYGYQVMAAMAICRGRRGSNAGGHYSRRSGQRWWMSSITVGRHEQVDFTWPEERRW